MKIKRLPEDFQVEELTRFRTDGGPYSLYQLTKRSIGTPEAIELIQRRWNLPRHRVSYGGLKDRHAVTMQYVTVHQGPRRDLQERQFDLKFLGAAGGHFTPKDIAGNRFKIVLRDMSAGALELAVNRIADVRTQGLPNYFDDQRFGSVGTSGEFVAVPWCLGNYERALWLALADPVADDRADEQDQKKILRDLWGQWKECKAALARSHRRSIVTFLDDRPGDFRGAFARINVDLRGLYLSAFQSSLWNLTLAELIRQTCGEAVENLELKLGSFPFPSGPTPPAGLPEAQLPLASARNKDELGEWEPLLTGVLSKYGLEVRQLRVKYPRDSFFSKGLRQALVSVADLEHETGPDDLYNRRHKLTVSFDLPRGSYATILVKRLTGATSASSAQAAEDAIVEDESRPEMETL